MKRLVLLALLLPVLAQATEGRYAGMSDSDRFAVAEKARQEASLPRRLELVSEPFVGTPYGISPLGEGSGIDSDPRLRWDSVDCLTFVETSIALSLAPSADQLLPVLDDIRYSATPPAFERRNHFVESEWIPKNVAKGYVRSIAAELMGEKQAVTFKMSRKRWHDRAEPQELPLPEKAVPMGSWSLDIMPIDFAREHADRIPNGTLLMVVREDSWRVPTRVSHVGFVMERGGQKILRHAAKKPYERVVDEPLARFLERNARYDKRPVVGFALFEVLAPTGRLASLAAPDGTP
jgi:hypothetical protein